MRERGAYCTRAGAHCDPDSYVARFDSVQALQDGNKTMLENQLTRPDLRDWIESRWFPGTIRTQALVEETQENDDDEADEQGSSAEPARKKKRKEDDIDAREEVVDFGQVLDMVGEEELAVALAEAEASELNLLKWVCDLLGSLPQLPLG